ncbi:MAG: 30S ribosomal protein S5 [Candidatus Odinarchaeota archaeon]|nr:30S ribosomal protein S5 [Candidatus Odinarchaeota archaeon]
MSKSLDEWVPRTKLGRLVREGHITSIDEIFQQALPIREAEIIDILLPNLREEVVDINLVQKQTDAGELSKFKVTVVVGNENGYIGIGEGKAREIGPAIRIAIRDAKMNIVPVRLGCGSWECGCGTPHSVPFRVEGKAGSVRVVLFPAPRGTGLVAADTIKVVLRLAGVKDIRSFSKGHTKTTVNFVKATYNALKNTYKIVAPYDWTR